ncbi:MAG: hypothetical protein ACXITV_11400 [Luteibaculaceae bacterium]
MLRNLSIAILVTLVFTACKKEENTQARSSASTNSAVYTSVGSSVAINNANTFDAVNALNGVKISHNNTTFFIGHRQVSALNQDPILMRFDNGNLTWSRTDYEVTGDDNTGYGLIWDGANAFYAVFSATGTQGTPAQDFRRFATQGWLTSYGQGGGAKVAILAKINPENGDVDNATFLTARLQNGNSNSMQVTGLAFDEAKNLQVSANSWFSPRRIDRAAFTCSGGSPFPYQIVFTPNLSTALSASAERCE